MKALRTKSMRAALGTLSAVSALGSMMLVSGPAMADDDDGDEREHEREDDEDDGEGCSRSYVWQNQRDSVLTKPAVKRARQAMRDASNASPSVRREATKAYRETVRRALRKTVKNGCVPIDSMPVPTPTPTTNPTVQLKDGTFLGAVSSRNKYGPVQVSITVTGGKLTGVSTPKYPNIGESRQINARAVPILESRAITAQSANIAAVSGASLTSPAFKQSLQSALSKANA